MSGVNVIVLGDNTHLNEALSLQLAPLFGYAPLHTNKIIQQLKGQTIDAFVQAEGEAELGLITDVSVLHVTPHHLFRILGSISHRTTE